MNFIEAVKKMQCGERVRLPHWGNKVHAKKEGSCYAVSSQMEIVSFREFSEREMLSNDWEIYKEEPKLHTFEEAFKAYKLGKYIYSISLEESKRSRYYGFSIHDKYKKEKEKVLIEARFKNDWVIGEVKEKNKMNFIETLECINCGEEYDVDDMISIDDDRDIYFCECGYENLLI